MRTIKIGFSPCPNDTFIFDALVNQKINTDNLRFEYCLEDVETLNQMALQGQLELTKLSFNTFLKVADQYNLLDSGSALGKGVGPLLISKKAIPPGKAIELAVQKAKIAIPGWNTTANLLLSLAFPNANNKTALLFHDIEEKVLSGEFDLGLIIHENRFTYKEKGLQKWMDLGDWWEKESASPIPLGGIVVRKDMEDKTAETIEDLIRESIEFSWKTYPALSKFVTDHAQEMEVEIMRKHIDLYVNEFTSSLGLEGRKAVNALFALAKKEGIIGKIPSRLYLRS